MCHSSINKNSCHWQTATIYGEKVCVLLLGEPLLWLHVSTPSSEFFSPLTDLTFHSQQSIKCDYRAQIKMNLIIQLQCMNRL